MSELMSAMPSATKSVAQLISGNTRPSGQVVHARNVLARAQKAIDDRQADRLPPTAREEFLEQVARLRLTLADVASLDDDDAADERGESDSEASEPPISMDRLRALALSIAGNAKPPEVIPDPQDVDDDEVDAHDAVAAAVANIKAAKRASDNKSSGSSRGLNSNSDKLRLKAVLDERRNSSDD